MSVKLKWPAVEDVQGALKNVRDGMEAGDLTDVRLQVYGPEHADEWPALDGRKPLPWAIRTGMSDYDTDHRGYWGASSVDSIDSDVWLMTTAEELLDQAKDHAAQNGLEVED